jgi:hypothetical protein
LATTQFLDVSGASSAGTFAKNYPLSFFLASNMSQISLSSELVSSDLLFKLKRKKLTGCISLDHITHLTIHNDNETQISEMQNSKHSKQEHLLVCQFSFVQVSFSTI